MAALLIRVIPGAKHGFAPVEVAADAVEVDYTAAADLDALNATLARALPHLRIVPEADAYAWNWAGEEDALDSMLWPVARSAGDLLTSDELKRVGECQGDGCGWLFLDMSRNRSRRWCDMGDCGNRAKARRHYHRQKVSLST